MLKYITDGYLFACILAPQFMFVTQNQHNVSD